MSASPCSIQDFFDISDKAKEVLGATAMMVSVSRAFTELSTLFSSAAKGVSKSLAPLHITRLAVAPFELISIMKASAMAVLAPSYMKLLPIMQIGESTGNIIDLYTVSIWIAEQFGATGIEALSTACTPLGGVALGLQALGIGILSWKIHAINEFLGSIEAAPNNNAKVGLLTNIPASKIDRCKQNFFGVLSSEDRADILSISNNKPHNVVPMLDLVKEHHVAKLAHAIASLVLTTIALVGIGLLIFGAATMAPIVWGVLGVVLVASLVQLGAGIYQDHSFKGALEALK